MLADSVGLALLIVLEALGPDESLAFVLHDTVVNGGPGIVSSIDGRVVAVVAFSVVDGLITEVDILADPQRLAALPAPSPLPRRQRTGGQR